MSGPAVKSHSTTKNLVPLVVPGLPSNSGTSSSSTSQPQDSSRTSSSPGQSEVTIGQEFKENFTDAEVPAPAHISHDWDSAAADLGQNDFGQNDFGQ